MPRIIRYIQDTRREMAHVSWPTRTQTIAFTLVVVLISVFVAVYLSVFDALFTQGLRVALDNAPRFSQTAPTTPNVDVQVASSTANASSTPNFTITPITSTTTTK